MNEFLKEGFIEELHKMASEFLEKEAEQVSAAKMNPPVKAPVLKEQKSSFKTSAKIPQPKSRHWMTTPKM